MRTRPFAGDLPPSANLVWLALDRYEIRRFGQLVRSLESTRLSEVGRAWKWPRASEERVKETRARARKWADVTTSRGLEWLTRHGLARKIGEGYLRTRSKNTGELDALLDQIVELEQRLRVVRTVWASNPEFPGKRRAVDYQQEWDATLLDLVDRLKKVRQGILQRALPRAA